MHKSFKHLSHLASTILGITIGAIFVMPAIATELPSCDPMTYKLHVATEGLALPMKVNMTREECVREKYIWEKIHLPSKKMIGVVTCIPETVAERNAAF